MRTALACVLTVVAIALMGVAEGQEERRPAAPQDRFEGRWMSVDAQPAAA